LVTIDTLRADRVGSYGAVHAHTPVLDTIAASGVRFELAISPAPLTLPAHTSLMTALDPPSHGVRHNSIYRLGDGIPTLAERLHEAGYRTGAVVGAVVLDGRFGLNRGFDHYDDAIAGEASATVGYSERRADAVVDRAVAWVETAPERFFLWVHFYDPHADYAPPPGFASAFASDPYAGEIAFVDAQLGRLLAALAERGPVEETLLVVTSDHGESLGEHGESTHAYTLYDATQRVPLLMRGSGLPQGRVVRDLVGLVDVAPTLLALVGAPPLEATDGVDLATAIKGRASADRRIYSETMATFLDYAWSPLWAVRTAHHRYVRAPRAELYDLRDDIGEERNLASDRPKLAAELEAWLSSRARVAPATGARLHRPLDDSERDQLRSLGYVVPDSDRPTTALPDAVTAVDPKDEIAVLRVLGQVQSDVDAGQLQRALARLASIESDGTAVAALRAAILVATADYTSAEADARRVLATQPGRSDLWIVLGRALAGQDRLEEAREAFATAARLEPNALEGHLFLGRADSETGRASDAVAAFERAHAIDPSAAEPTWRLALAYFEDGKAAQAAAILAEAERAGVEFGPAVTARIASQEARSGAIDRAAARVRRARERFPEDPELARVSDWIKSAQAASRGPNPTDPVGHAPP